MTIHTHTVIQYQWKLNDLDEKGSLVFLRFLSISVYAFRLVHSRIKISLLLMHIQQLRRAII